MSQSVEIEISNLLSEAEYYENHKEQDESYQDKSAECIQIADKIIKANIRYSLINLSYDVLIQFVETAINIPGQEDLSEYYVDLFFQHNQSKGQMYIRALFVKARLIALNGHKQFAKGEEMIAILSKALAYVHEALEIIKNADKQKYSFLIYNASVCVYNIVRFMLKSNWAKYFTEIVRTLDTLFDDVDEPDYNWRCRYTWMLFQCLYDSDMKQESIRLLEANKVLEKLWEVTKRKGACNFQDHLLRLRIHLCKESPGPLVSIKREIESNKEDERGWKLLLTLQMMKSGLILEAQIEKELINVINSMSSSILPGNEMAQTNKLAPIILERLAEAGRIALHHNLINIADSITSFLGRVRQPVQVLQEYNKAELRIKKAGALIDTKTGMRLNQTDIKLQEVKRRTEALRILEKAMHAIGSNKSSRGLDSDLVYDGAVLIWNISLPFLNESYRKNVIKAFNIACDYLERIESNDHALRLNFHLELAKTVQYDDIPYKAQEHIQKALRLDSSIPFAKVKNLLKDDQDKTLYQRPYERYLRRLQDKIALKSNPNAEAKTVIQKVILDLENASNSKSDNTKIDILQKCLGNLVNLEEKEYVHDLSRNLVDEEIHKEKVKHKQDNLYQYKQKKLLAQEIAEMAFDLKQDDLAMKACEFVVANTWEITNSEEMILAQVQCYYLMAQITIFQLIKEKFIIAFAEPVRIEGKEEQQSTQGSGSTGSEELSAAKKEEVLTRKRNLVDYFLKGLELADSINQSWLVFNGAIYIWNYFLSIFRNPIYDSKLLDSISLLLKKFFETMKVSFKELEKKQIIDYDRDTKIQVNANIGLVYARLMEGKKEYDEVMRVCEALLQLPLGSHTRKLINSIKARVAGAQKTGGNKAPEKGGKPAKGAPEQAIGTSTEHVLFEVVSQLEIITNSTNTQQRQDLIKKCFETLRTWNAKENDETELELHAELWARLARLSLNKDNVVMLKYSLRCVENSLSLLNPNTDLQGIPSSRLRWYSLAEYLYSENLLQMLDPDTQEQKSQEQLLFHALKHAVEGANKGLKAGISMLVIDSSKLIWNICAKLQDSALNRKALIKPIFSTIFYLKSCKERNEPNLVLSLSQLLFRAALENEEYHLGENVADMVFELIQTKQKQKPVWEAKMIFMSKQGKNELQAISNMKEADASLQSKVWIRLARASNAIYKQYNAYSKAIEILKKENSQEIVEVYIEFAEWLLRNPENNNNSNSVVSSMAGAGLNVQNGGNLAGAKENEGNERFPSALANVVQQLELAADILISIDNDGDEIEEDFMEYDEKSFVIFSRLDKKSTLSRTTKTKNKQSMSKKASTATTKVHKKIEQKEKRGQTSSRMMQASIGVANTINSNQSKRIFQQREEDDSNPEGLNCAHFERLMRIHAMMAMVSPKQETQIQYCLDAKLFLIKIFEISFNELNKFEVNEGKYKNVNQQNPNDKQGQPQQSSLQQSQLQLQQQQQQQQQQLQSSQLSYLKSQEQQASEQLPTYQFPQNVEDWIKLEFSEKFIEKVTSSEDYMFMGKYLFEKAEVTFTYVNYLISVFEAAGLHVHNIPLLVFQRFFAREIIASQDLAPVYDLKFIKLLHLLGYHTDAERLSLNHQVRLKLTEHKKKNLLAKTESSKILSTTKKAVDLSEQIIPKPNLVKEISQYQIWFDLGKELFYTGDLIRAKDLFNEAYKHVKILLEKEMMGEIHLYFGAIYYLEGEYEDSLDHHMKSHKLIKEIPTLELSAIETTKTLKKLKKFEDINMFLSRMIDVFSYQVSNLLSIEQILCTLHLLLAKTCLARMRRSYSEELEFEAFRYLRSARDQFQRGGIKLIHAKIILSIFEKLFGYCEGLNLSDIQNVNIAHRLLYRMQIHLARTNSHLVNLLKYSILIDCSSKNVQTPLAVYHSRMRVKLASTFAQYGLIKSIKRKFDNAHLAFLSDAKRSTNQQGINGSGNVQNQDIDDPDINEDDDNLDRPIRMDGQANDAMLNTQQLLPQPTGGDNKNVKLNDFLTKLLKQIEFDMLYPNSSRFESFEKTAQILEQIRSTFPLDSYDYIIASIEYARTRRLLAEEREQMHEIWKRKRVETQHSMSQFGATAAHAVSGNLGNNHGNAGDQNASVVAADASHPLLNEIIESPSAAGAAAAAAAGIVGGGMNLLQHSDTVQMSQSSASHINSIDYLGESVAAVQEIYSNAQQFSIDDPIKSKHSSTFMKKFSYEFLENNGIHGSAQSFEFLVKFQHYNYTEFLVQLIKKAMQGKHKFVTFQRLIKHVYSSAAHLNQEAFKALTMDFKIWHRVYSSQPYNEIVADLLPKRSAYLILQFSSDQRYLYFGFMGINKHGKMTETKVDRKEMRSDDHAVLEKIKHRLNFIKTALIKTPIIQEKDFQQIVNNQEDEYLQVLADLEDFCKFFTNDIPSLISGDAHDTEDNKHSDSNQEENDGNHDSDHHHHHHHREFDRDGHTATAAVDDSVVLVDGSGHGDDSHDNHNNNINSDHNHHNHSSSNDYKDNKRTHARSKSAVETLVLLLDTQLFNLPFDQLQVFKGIPAVSRDFSLIQLAKRYDSAATAASADALINASVDAGAGGGVGSTDDVQLNNNTDSPLDIDRSKLKYIAYSFKQDDPDNKQYDASHVLNSPNSPIQWNGVSSCDRIASIGEWQTQIRTSSLLLFYGNPGLMNILTPRLLIDMNEASQVSTMVIIDKINAKKTVLEKYSSLDPEGDRTPLHESLLHSSILLSMLGVSSIASTQWAVETQLIPQMLDSFTTQLANRTYFASALQKFKEPQIVYVDRNGVPVDFNKDSRSKQPHRTNPITSTSNNDKPDEPSNQHTQKLLPRKRLATDNLVFIGVPNTRLSK